MSFVWSKPFLEISPENRVDMLFIVLENGHVTLRVNWKTQDSLMKLEVILE